MKPIEKSCPTNWHDISLLCCTQPQDIYSVGEADPFLAEVYEQKTNEEALFDEDFDDEEPFSDDEDDWDDENESYLPVLWDDV